MLGCMAQYNLKFCHENLEIKRLTSDQALLSLDVSNEELKRFISAGAGAGAGGGGGGGDGDDC